MIPLAGAARHLPVPALISVLWLAAVGSGLRTLGHADVGRSLFGLLRRRAEQLLWPAPPDRCRPLECRLSSTLALPASRLGYRDNCASSTSSTSGISHRRTEDFDDGTFERTARSPLTIPITLTSSSTSHRWRLSLAQGTTQYGDPQARLFFFIIGRLPTAGHRRYPRRGRCGRTCLCGEVLGCAYSHRSPGRHRTQRAPRSPGRVHRRHTRSRRRTDNAPAVRSLLKKLTPAPPPTPIWRR